MSEVQTTVRNKKSIDSSRPNKEIRYHPVQLYQYLQYSLMYYTDAIPMLTLLQLYQYLQYSLMYYTDAIPMLTLLQLYQ